MPYIGEGKEMSEFKNFSPISVSAARNGIIVREDYRTDSATTENNIYVFNSENDFFIWFTEHIGPPMTPISKDK